jgi:hypothetical protein
MAFTYLGTLATNLDKVRFYIGDTVSGTGVKPDGSNFTDAEINGVLTVAGTWSAAVVQILRNLASLYAGKATSIQVFEYRKQYADRAAQYTALADNFVKSTPAVWSGLVGWNSTTSSGDEPGHMFGKAQWGANPEDWSE